jgi:hypothetical protein
MNKAHVAGYQHSVVMCFGCNITAVTNSHHSARLVLNWLERHDAQG